MKNSYNAVKRLRLSHNLAEMAQTVTGESHQEYLYKLLSAETQEQRNQ